MEDKLRVGIQKKGRLAEKSLKLFQKCGFEFENYSNSLSLPCLNFPLELIMLRDDDIPTYVGESVCDFGIVGENIFLERIYNESLNGPVPLKELDLPFGKCRMSLAFPEEKDPSALGDLNGKTIATTYPQILRNFLRERNIECQIIYQQGSVEVATGLGIADGIFDIVSTGNTLRANKLKESLEVRKINSILIQSPTDKNQKKRELSFQLLERIKSSLLSEVSRYLMMNVPKGKLAEILEVLPGVDGPSVLNLKGNSEKVAIHAVTKETILWEKMAELKRLGASSILVSPIEKMVE